jgi:hypothetical protein
MPKSLQDRLLMLAGQAKKEEQVGCVWNYPVQIKLV